MDLNGGLKAPNAPHGAVEVEGGAPSEVVNALEAKANGL